MAKMGTRGLDRKREPNTTQSSDTGLPESLPVNLIAGQIESAPVTVRYVGAYYPLGNPIMREGFTTDTGLRLSTYDFSIKSL